jgi:hypothetical protein
MSDLLSRVRKYARSLEAEAWTIDNFDKTVRKVLHEELPRGDFSNRDRLLAMVLLATRYSDAAVIGVVTKLLGWKDDELNDLRSEIKEVSQELDAAEIKVEEATNTANFLEDAEKDAEKLTDKLRDIGKKVDELKPYEIRKIVSEAINEKV